MENFEEKDLRRLEKRAGFKAAAHQTLGKTGLVTYFLVDAENVQKAVNALKDAGVGVHSVEEWEGWYSHLPPHCSRTKIRLPVDSERLRGQTVYTWIDVDEVKKQGLS